MVALCPSRRLICAAAPEHTLGARLLVREAGPAEARVREQHHADLRHGAGWVELPGALMRKYPNAGRDWGWQWSSPPRASTWIASRGNGVGTTSTNPCFNGR